MARFSGRDLVTIWAYSGGSVSLDDDFRNLTISEEVNDADSTAGNDTYAGHLPTFTDASADYEMLGTTGSGTAHWTAIAPRTEGTVYWYPEGTASGKPKHYAPAYIQARERTYPYDDVVQVNLTFQFSSTPTDSVVA
jgi:hypothetical protein